MRERGYTDTPNHNPIITLINPLGYGIARCAQPTFLLHAFRARNNDNG